jgi:hypothetical protein
MMMAGFLPFSAIYIELYYIFATVWGHKVRATSLFSCSVNCNPLGRQGLLKLAPLMFSYLQPSGEQGFLKLALLMFSWLQSSGARRSAETRSSHV